MLYGKKAKAGIVAPMSVDNVVKFTKKIAELGWFWVGLLLLPSENSAKINQLIPGTQYIFLNICIRTWREIEICPGVLFKF